MTRQARRDTRPEIALRRELHRRGLRYRVDVPLQATRRRADLVFSKARVAVFVDGCFWHSCPSHGTMPKANRNWWAAKLEMNRRRDADTNRRLKENGWQVIRVWEHEPPTVAATRIARVLNARRATRR
jgi:DNA mismatch endonuclease (patch repair protein)